MRWILQIFFEVFSGEICPKFRGNLSIDNYYYWKLKNPKWQEKKYSSFTTLRECIGYICAFLNELLFFLAEICRISTAIDDASL